MANIIYNIAEFQCVSPVMGDTFRQGGEWRFNWTSQWDLYTSLGLNTNIKLFYSGDGQPEVEYTNQTIPANANSFLIDDIINFDTVNFRVLFTIDNGTTCSKQFIIPNSSIIIT
jgi:hypothetical protein